MDTVWFEALKENLNCGMYGIQSVSGCGSMPWPVVKSILYDIKGTFVTTDNDSL